MIHAKFLPKICGKIAQLINDKNDMPLMRHSNVWVQR